MRPFYCLFVFTIVVSPVLGQQTPLSGDSIPSDAEIRKVLIDRVDVLHKSTRMVVGIVTPSVRIAKIVLSHLTTRHPDLFQSKDVAWYVATDEEVPK
jgi:hypothetical protein